MLAFRPIQFEDEPYFPYRRFRLNFYHAVLTYNKTTNSYDRKFHSYSL